jgi:Tfp pilus assembly protein PilX
MSNNRNTSRQRGAALVVGLILLAIITLLAVVGMNISNAELASATSEQLRLRAFQSAETGVEYAMTDIIKRPSPIPAKCHAVLLSPVTDVAGSPLNSATGLPADKYATRISYVDETAINDGFSASKFKSYHFAIESHGTSSRNAISKNIQGTYTVNQGGDPSWGKLGTDCYIPVTAGF